MTRIKQKQPTDEELAFLDRLQSKYIKTHSLSFKMRLNGMLQKAYLVVFGQLSSELIDDMEKMESIKLEREHENVISFYTI